MLRTGAVSLGAFLRISIILVTAIFLTLPFFLPVAAEVGPASKGDSPPGPGGSASAPADVSPGWMGRVEKGIRDAEYRITWQTETALPGLKESWQAPNRAQGFRTYFTERGIRVIPRTQENPDWEWSLELAGYGRGDQVDATGASKLTPNDRRIEYARDGLIEWYVNTPGGLEQGFTLEAPPRGRGGEPLSLEMAIGADTLAFVSEDKQSIEFRTGEGRRLIDYSKLRATDAEGRKLESWFEAYAARDSRGIRIRVDDSRAVYPLTVDPLATSPAWTAESDVAYSYFGYSVATAGDVNGDGYADVVVGAYNYDISSGNEGRAYLYEGSPSGLSASPAWVVDGGQTGSWFGHSVATAGDVNGDGYSDVIVGSPHFDNGQNNEGRAYLYLGSAAGLQTTHAWTAESNWDGANFGNVVSTAGDVNGDGYSDVIIGAEFFGSFGSAEGRVYVYLGSASGLSSSIAWARTGSQQAAFLGTSVSTAGDVNGDGYSDVIIGAHGYDNGQSDEGIAYVYVGSASGLSPSPAWTAESNHGGAFFGASVSTAGDVNCDGYSDVIVGAFGWDFPGSGVGQAYVYLGSSSGLASSAAWTATGTQVAENLGISVATAGDVDGNGCADVIVGAWRYGNGQAEEGKVSVFPGSPAGLASTPSWSVEGGQANAQLGRSVFTAGDVNGDGFSDVIVGAHAYDGGETDEGRAYVYMGSASGPEATASWNGQSNQAYSGYGYSVSSAGDVNGDGYSDVIVGAPVYDNGSAIGGRAFVYLGSSSGSESSPSWFADGPVFSQFGSSVSTAGDVNGDGFSDVIIGAQNCQGDLPSEGCAFIYLGAPQGLAAVHSWYAEGDQSGATFGSAVSTAGDVNGDGYSDVIVGAPGHDLANIDQGMVYVYLGSSSGVQATASWTAASDPNGGGARFGAAVSTAGDVNGDGFSDVIIGATQYSNSAAEPSEGAAFVYLGSASGLAPAPVWTGESNQAFARFGEFVSTAGDVDGDGYSDIIVGAPYFDAGAGDEGAAFLHLGSPSGPSSVAAWSVDGGAAMVHLGPVSTAGDVNGDGYGDIVVGAPEYTNGEGSEGGAFVYLGSGSGPATTPVWTGEGNQLGASFGSVVATAGDVNGDGYSDLVVTAYDISAYDDEVLVYHGDGGAGHVLHPRQLKSDGSPIARLGASDQSDSFDLSFMPSGVYGGSSVKLELEVKPYGVPLDGSGTDLTTGWSLAPSEFQITVAGLAPDTLYHWRGRFIYDLPTSPFQQTTPWFSDHGGGWQEADLRTAATSCVDSDGDGYGFPGDPNCPNGAAPDCDDGSAATYPGAPQICDGLNNDCGHASYPGLAGTNDGDDDGDSISECSGDCDDAAGTVYPGAPQLCDGLNNDCNDPGYPAPPADELTDADTDGYLLCADCDDADPAVYPGAPEICDGFAYDCNDPSWPAAPLGEIDRIKLSGPLDPNHEVEELFLTPDGQYALYLVDTVDWRTRQLHSVPAAGGIPQQLAPPFLDPDWGLNRPFQIARDSGSVFYYLQQSSAPYKQRLFIEPITGGTPVEPPEGSLYLADTPLLQDGRIRVDSTPDGSKVIFSGHVDPNNPSSSMALYSVPASGGAATLLRQGFNEIVSFKPDPSSARVVFLHTDVGYAALYSVPVAGGTPVQLNSPVPGSSVGLYHTSYEPTPDGSAVIFIQNLDTGSTQELYHVPITGGTITKLNAPLNPGSHVVKFLFTPDGNTVLYVMVSNLGINDIYSVPTTGGTAVSLTNASASGVLIDEESLGVTPDGQHVLFEAQLPDTHTGLFSVPLAGGTTVELSVPMVAGGDVLEYAISPDSSTAVYSADQIVDGRWEIFTVPVGGGTSVGITGTPELVDAWMPAITSDGTAVVYLSVSRVSGYDEIGAVSIQGGVARILSGRAGGVSPVDPFLVTPDGAYALYMSTEDSGVTELFRSAIVQDGDGDLFLGHCDCDDANPDVYPGAPQLCDGINNDCDDPGYPAPPTEEVSDLDSDGFVDCLDCNPWNEFVYPGAPEICDNLNNDCDDPDYPNTPASDLDTDGDGETPCFGDCDDSDATVYRFAPQICDGKNNNCSDPSWPSLLGTNDGDDDGDTFTECTGDCDDNAGNTYPGALEANDGVDNQCPGDRGYLVVDEVSGGPDWDPNASETVCWPAQPGATMYEVVRTTARDLSTGCTTIPTSGTCLTSEIPPPGEAYFYAVSAQAPNAGSWGLTATGEELVVRCLAGETICDDGVDNDSDGLTDCADPECASDVACRVYEYSFIDTSGDDVAADSLYDFFQGLTAGPGDYIFIEATYQGDHRSFCMANAGWYRSEYLANYTSGYSQSGTWDKWYRYPSTSSPWNGPYNMQFYNYYGSFWTQSYSWYVEDGFGIGGSLAIDPADMWDCEAADTSDSFFECEAAESMTLRIGPSRLTVCGF